MADSKTDIANQALILLGADTITSLTEERTEARAVNTTFDTCLDYVLSLHPWKCTVARTELAADTTAPAFEYDAQFTLPSDLLRLLRIYDLPSREYRVEGNKILSNESSLKILYISRVEDIPRLQPFVAEVLVHYLAYRIAYRLRPDQASDMYKLYRDVLSKNKFLDGSQNPVEQIQPNELIDARLQGTVW